MSDCDQDELIATRKLNGLDDNLYKEESNIEKNIKIAEYRYMIWNDVKKEYQFPRICETTEKGANTCLFNLIGNDARKYRFKVVRVEKEKAKVIIQELKRQAKISRLHRELPNIDYGTLHDLVIKNEKV